MAGSGDGSGDEVRFGTVSLDLFGGLPCRALPPGEGDLKARVSLVCDPPPSNDSLITSTGVT